MHKNIVCHNCQKPLSFETNAHIGRRDECHHCYASIHSCMMCTDYSPSAYNECKETMADRVIDKEKANFCDFYKLGRPSNNKDHENDLLSQANNLFKN